MLTVGTMLAQQIHLPQRIEPQYHLFPVNDFFRNQKIEPASVLICIKEYSKVPSKLLQEVLLKQ